MAKLKPQDYNYKTKEDICTHVGDEYADFMGAIVPPIFQNSLFLKPTPYNGIPEDNEFVYTRVSNPTTDIAERKIASPPVWEQFLRLSCTSSKKTAMLSHLTPFMARPVPS